jgi:hypothetical protein
MARHYVVSGSLQITYAVTVEAENEEAAEERVRSWCKYPFERLRGGLTSVVDNELIVEDLEDS